jgi:hypothetical protein
MTRRGTVLLIGVLVALVGYLWLVESRRAAHPPPAVAEEPPLLDGPSGAVARVELLQGDTRITALRRDDTWVDADGRAWDGNALADLLETLTGLRPVMEVDPSPDDDAGYGLGPAAQRLQISGTDGRSLLALDIGERNPAWTGLYVRRVGERRVVLVGAVLRWELEKLRDAAPGG